MRNHFHTGIGHHRVQTLTILNLWDVLEKPLCSGSTHIKDTRSNNVTLDGNKLQMLQTMLQGMCAAVKA